MAIVRHLEKHLISGDQPHTETTATYSVVSANGESFIQIDTYGSEERKLAGKKSQSIRFAESSIRELELIISQHFKKNPTGR